MIIARVNQAKVKSIFKDGEGFSTVEVTGGITITFKGSIFTGGSTTSLGASFWK